MVLTNELAQFVEAQSYDDFSETLRRLSTEHIFDTIAVGIAGLNSETGAIMFNYGKEQGGTPVSTVIGGYRTGPQIAALVNGTICHVHDYDDDSLNTVSHPSPVIVPAILAVGELIGCSGKDIITAHVVGVEVLSQISSIVNLHHYLKGWHATSTLGIFGAAAGCAKLLKLDANQIANALAIAASCASGLQSNFGTMTKPLHAGHAAQSGVMAALLAKNGFTANKNALDSDKRNGFFDLYSDREFCKFDTQRVMGDPYELEDPGLNFKYYPNCSGLHAVLDCAIELVERHNVAPDSVQRIDAIMSKMLFDILHYQSPKNTLEAKFSVEFALATAVANRSCSLNDLTDEVLSSPIIQRLMSKVVRQERPAVSGECWPSDAKVVITLNNGTELSNYVESYVGHALFKPFTREHHLEKFRDCYEFTYGQGDVGAYIETFLEHFSEFSDIRHAMELLMKPFPGSAAGA